MKSSFLSDLPSCPSTFSAASLVTLNLAPLWLRPNVAVQMSSLARYEIERLIKEKLVKVAWRPNKAGTRMPLIYAPSLWEVMDKWTALDRPSRRTGGCMNPAELDTGPPDPEMRPPRLVTEAAREESVDLTTSATYPAATQLSSDLAWRLHVALSADELSEATYRGISHLGGKRYVRDPPTTPISARWDS